MKATDGKQGCFITGTDTDVGKTLITAGLLRQLLLQGEEVVALKPVETGCSPDAADVCEFQKIAKNTPSPLYSLEVACSPHFAADLEDVEISLDAICDYVKQHQQSGKLTLLEGAGGLLVPLAGEKTLLDLIEQLPFGVIVVVANRIGAINHTLLTLETLRSRGCNILGVVVNHCEPASKEETTQKILADNIATIARLGKVQILAEIPYFPNPDIEQVATYLGEASEAITNQPATSPQTTNALLAFDQKHLWHPYSSMREPLPTYLANQTSGTQIFLEGHDEPLIDGMSSWWCAIHGYNRPELADAVRAQLAKMPHVMFGGLTHRPALELAELLFKITPEGLDRVFYADSGSVAVEVAIKMALQHALVSRPGKPQRLLTVRGGYHGDTFGAMSVCDPVTGMHTLFSGLLPEQIFVERPSCRFDAPFDPTSLDALRATIEQQHDAIAAVILEPIVQGAGGMWFYHPDYLRGVRKLCDTYNITLIFDEIATGFGRTGKLFASEWAEVVPDILCLGKAITGGTLSFAATLTTEKIAGGISSEGGVLMHGPTFMANPLACACAIAATNLLLAGDWASDVRRIETELEKGLASLRGCEGVRDVRVLGAIGVVEMDEPVDVAALQRFFIARGVWLRPFGKLIYVMPPYITTNAELKRLTMSIHQAVAEAHK